MSPDTTLLEDRLESVPSSALDGLIADCFDRAFLFFNLFVDDPRNCLDLSESVFRMLGGRGAATEHDFYREVVEHVRALPEKNELGCGVPADSVLCWLLKDSAELSYHEIGAVMTMDRAQVQQRIAEVRMALLG